MTGARARTARIRSALAGEDDDRGATSRERNFLDDLNPASKRIITAFVEPALAQAAAEDRFQFERHGYFVADLIDHAPGRLVFNRTVTLQRLLEQKARLNGVSQRPNRVRAAARTL